MSTLRRLVIQKLEEILVPALSDNPQTQDAEIYAKELAEKCADAVLELRLFKEPAEQPKEPFSLEDAEPAWAIAAGKPITQKAVNKQAEIFDREIMIDRELSRLPLLWSGFKEQEQDRFRKFIKKQALEGRNLETWVNWWMSDEQRVANPPWTLGIIMTRWLQGFPKAKIFVDNGKDENDITMSY